MSKEFASIEDVSFEQRNDTDIIIRFDHEDGGHIEVKTILINAISFATTIIEYCSSLLEEKNMNLSKINNRLEKENCKLLEGEK